MLCIYSTSSPALDHSPSLLQFPSLREHTNLSFPIMNPFLFTKKLNIHQLLHESCGPHQPIQSTIITLTFINLGSSNRHIFLSGFGRRRERGLGSSLSTASVRAHSSDSCLGFHSTPSCYPCSLTNMKQQLVEWQPPPPPPPLIGQ